MKTFDYVLQYMRIRQAKPFIPKNARVLDIGCSDGVLFKMLQDQISGGVGIDPDLDEPVEWAGVKLIPGWFPGDFPPSRETFDAVTALAVLEHIPPCQQKEFALACGEYLKPGGRLIVTVPAKQVDTILKALKQLRLIDGMSLEEHYGFEPSQAAAVIDMSGLNLISQKKFQLGLNNLYVFQKEES